MTPSQRIFAAGPWLLAALASCPPTGLAGEEMHTFDGKHSIAKVEVTAVYFVPRDRTPLLDWRERVDYYARRVEAFHRRELGGRSELTVRVRPTPLVSKRSAAEVRGGDPDATFSNTTDEAREALRWPGERGPAFPILLVFSDINWRELDDFRRVRVVDGRDEHEGNIGAGGRHFPGAESGGARATYWDGPGFGFGLVSADGWRVPYSGSDCVAYHEGVGHPIGLPHPDPIDGSVMGVAQYQGWLNETRLETGQQRALGWVSTVGKEQTRPTLFDAFTAIPSPAVPGAGVPVELILNWPAEAEVRSLRVRYQTELTGPWREVDPGLKLPSAPPGRLPLAKFERPTPVSYRVDASLADGQSVEIWGYFQAR